MENNIEKRMWGFPGGIAVKNLPCNAGDKGWIPVGKISNASEQLSPGDTAAEPESWSPGAATGEPRCSS